MTGLDPDTDCIIEIYCLITDGQLQLLDDSGWGTVVHQPRERMAAMGEWCTRIRMFWDRGHHEAQPRMVPLGSLGSKVAIIWMANRPIRVQMGRAASLMP